jgi:hypothetical protein
MFGWVTRSLQMWTPLEMQLHTNSGNTASKSLRTCQADTRFAQVFSGTQAQSGNVPAFGQIHPTKHFLQTSENRLSTDLLLLESPEFPIWTLSLGITSFSPTNHRTKPFKILASYNITP